MAALEDAIEYNKLIIYGESIPDMEEGGQPGEVRKAMGKVRMFAGMVSMIMKKTENTSEEEAPASALKNGAPIAPRGDSTQFERNGTTGAQLPGVADESSGRISRELGRQLVRQVSERTACPPGARSRVGNPAPRSMNGNRRGEEEPDRHE